MPNVVGPKMIKTFVVSLLSIFLCVSPSTSQDKSNGISIIYPNRSIDDWMPENAIVEAESDIQNNRLKVYYSGTYTATPIGISQEDAHLVKELPKADGGIGCVITNPELRKNQSDYAKKYNEIIIKHLKRTKAGTK